MWRREEGERKTLGKGDIKPGMRKEVRRHSRWRKGPPRRLRNQSFLQYICHWINHNMRCHPGWPLGMGQGYPSTHGLEEQKEDLMCAPSSATQLLSDLGQVTSLP